jgi:hypothetical protein
MDQASRVISIQAISTINVQLIKLIDFVKNPIPNTQKIKDLAIIITNHFTTYIPNTLDKALEFGVNETEVDRFYNEFVNEQKGQKFNEIENSLKKYVQSTYNILNSGYIEADMFFKDTLFAFNYWIEYIKLLVDKGILSVKFYNNLKTYNRKLLNLSLNDKQQQTISYMMKYLKYKNKFLNLRKQIEEFNNIQ